MQSHTNLLLFVNAIIGFITLQIQNFDPMGFLAFDWKEIAKCIVSIGVSILVRFISKKIERHFDATDTEKPQKRRKIDETK